MKTNLKKLARKIRDKDLVGINITLPFKQKIIPFLDALINDAKQLIQLIQFFLIKTIV